MSLASAGPPPVGTVHPPPSSASLSPSSFPRAAAHLGPPLGCPEGCDNWEPGGAPAVPSLRQAQRQAGLGAVATRKGTPPGGFVAVPACPALPD